MNAKCCCVQVPFLFSVCENVAGGCGSSDFKKTTALPLTNGNCTNLTEGSGWKVHVWSPSSRFYRELLCATSLACVCRTHSGLCRCCTQITMLLLCAACSSTRAMLISLKHTALLKLIILKSVFCWAGLGAVDEEDFPLLPRCSSPSRWPAHAAELKWSWQVHTCHVHTWIVFPTNWIVSHNWICSKIWNSLQNCN